MILGTNSRQKGFTLIELVMFIVIVSVGIAGILVVFNMTVKASADPLVQKQAQALAEGLLEEIQTASFAYCDPSDPLFREGSVCTVNDQYGDYGSETRPYDTVKDYASAANTPTALSSILPGESPVSTPSGYDASVTIGPASLGGITQASGDALLISVTVTGPGNTTALAEGFKTRQVPQ